MMEIEWSSFIVIAISPLLYGWIDWLRIGNTKKKMEKMYLQKDEEENGEYDWLCRN